MRHWAIVDIRQRFECRRKWYFSPGSFREQLVRAWIAVGRPDKAKRTNDRRVAWITKGWPSNFGVA